MKRMEKAGIELMVKLWWLSRSRVAFNYLASLVALSLVAAAVSFTPSQARQFLKALPGYHFSFPRDHYSHDDYKTEWWYYTGHLETREKRRYGYELTFFRSGAESGTQPETKKSPWTLSNIYLAHFAISDEHNKKFHFYEKLNRAGLSTAGASQETYCVFNENWSVEALGDRFVLRADVPEFKLRLILTGDKPLVVHGINGVSQKASCEGCASHYYSMTRLKSEGTLYVGGHPQVVTGLSWMDHEFGSNQLTEEQVGWDWYSIQLNDKRELMLYVMRTTKGTIDPNSSGTIVSADGSSRHLQLKDFQIDRLGSWQSPHSQAKYPIGWKIKVPSEKLTLELRPLFVDQELTTRRSTGVIYWEGACDAAGFDGGKPVAGQAYVEMTGYAEKFRKNI